VFCERKIGWKMRSRFSEKDWNRTSVANLSTMIWRKACANNHQMQIQLKGKL